MIHWLKNKKRTTNFIPQIEPWIDSSELKELKRVVKSTYVVENQLTKEFEEMVSSYSGSLHTVAMTNGTAALFCCLKALGVGPGDEVLVPNITFVATANVVLWTGATPVFCEVDPKTMCLDVKILDKYVTNKTSAVIPVHLYGQSVDMYSLMSFCEKHNLYCIEDAAQGVGVKFDGKHVGTFGDCGVYSYYGNKTITCGEGGVVLTGDKEIAKKCFRLKNHGRDVKGVFIHEHIGYNFCFTDMQAAIGISQMKKLDRVIAKKQQIHERYHECLSGVLDLEPFEFDSRTSPVHWFTSYLTTDRDNLMSYLKDKNIQTRLFFYPLHMQPCYDGKYNVGSYDLSESLYDRGISLPSSVKLKWKDQKYIIKCIKEYFKNGR